MWASSSSGPRTARPAPGITETIHGMELAEIYHGQLSDAANVLVLSSLSPNGTEAYTRLLATASADADRMVVVTYTQPPQLWLSDWNQYGHDLSVGLTFIHGGPASGEDVTDQQPPIDGRRVDPRKPMDIITGVTEEMQHPGYEPVVVSVQTLTVLLEYVDFDTAFRYLHVLLHRVRGTDAVGFYQMDPSIHEPETINTLSVLFDVVVRADVDSDGTTEWSVVKAMSGDQPAADTESDRGSDLLASTAAALREVVESLRRWLQVRSSSSSGTEHAQLPNPQSADIERNGGGESHADVSEPTLMTDEERIRALLTDAGGRMNQADIIEHTEWSGPTVSRKLSKMEEAGLITRVQVGRGNLVFLAGHQPNITDPDDAEWNGRA